MPTHQESVPPSPATTALVQGATSQAPLPRGQSIWEGYIASGETDLESAIRRGIGLYRLFRYREALDTLKTIIDTAPPDCDPSILARANRYAALSCESLGQFSSIDGFHSAAVSHQALVPTRPRHPLDLAVQMYRSYDRLDEQGWQHAHTTIAEEFVKICREFEDFDLVCYYMLLCPQPVSDQDGEREQLSWQGYAGWHEDDRLAMSFFGPKSVKEQAIHPIMRAVYERHPTDPEVALTWSSILAGLSSVTASEFLAFYEDPVRAASWAHLVPASFEIMAARKRLSVHGDKNRFMQDLVNARSCVRSERDGRGLEDLIAQTTFEIDLSNSLGGAKVTWHNVTCPAEPAHAVSGEAEAITQR